MVRAFLVSLLGVLGSWAVCWAEEAPAGPLSGEEVSRLQALDAKPLQQFSGNVELAEYLSLRSRRLHDNLPAPADGIAQFAQRAKAQAFKRPAGRFDLQESDCVTFTERSIVLGLATDWRSYHMLANRLRHKDGVVDYRQRNLATLADWVPNNAWLLEDVSGTLGRDKGAPAGFTHAVRPKVFVDIPAQGDQPARTVFKGSDYKSGQVEIRHDTYIPKDRIADILPELRTGDVFLMLRPSAGGHLACEHMGIVSRAEDGSVVFVHSTVPKVRQDPPAELIKRCFWISGFKFLRVRENARTIVNQELTACASKLQVAEPAAVDQEVQVHRADRAKAEAAKKRQQKKS